MRSSLGSCINRTWNPSIFFAGCCTIQDATSRFAQAKLLRFLEDGEVRPLGSKASRRVNVRVIAATNADLEKKIAAGEFREDLYYRLSVFPVELPPLRDRPEDLAALAHHFIGKAGTRLSKEVSAIAPAALDALMRHTFPGNVRELSNVIERAVLLCEAGGVIVTEHLPAPLTNMDARRTSTATAVAGEGLKASVQRFEAELIARALDKHEGNQSRTARNLGIAQRTLNEKIHKYGIGEAGVTYQSAVSTNRVAER